MNTEKEINGDCSTKRPQVTMEGLRGSDPIYTISKPAESAPPAAPAPASLPPRVTTKPQPFNVRSVLPAGAIPVLAELVATGLLVMLGCMSCIHLVGSDEPPQLLQIVLAFGIAVMFNIQIFGHVSGAHMNPAVTLASMLMRLMPPVLGLCYIVAQCAGAIFGYGLLTLLTPDSSAPKAPNGFCTTLPHEEVTVFQALMVEVAITTVLILITCSFWDPVHKEKTDSLAIKFGLTIVGLSLAGGPFTGASMNPARSLGPAVWNNMWRHHWIYWAAPMFSAVLGALVYKFLFQTRPQTPTAADPAEVLPLSAREKGAGGAA